MKSKTQVNETMIKSRWVRKHCWIGHVLWHDELLSNLMEGRMVGNLQEGYKC